MPFWAARSLGSVSSAVAEGVSLMAEMEGPGRFLAPSVGVSRDYVGLWPTRQACFAKKYSLFGQAQHPRSLQKGWLNRIIGTDWKNLKRQDAKCAKGTRYGASEISFESSQKRSVYDLTWRTWRLGGENIFTLPNGVALALSTPSAACWSLRPPLRRGGIPRHGSGWSSSARPVRRGRGNPARSARGRCARRIAGS